MKSRVLVYKSDLLPYSETFIKEQVLACARWHPVLVGTHIVNGLSLDGLDVRLLRGGGGGRATALAWKLWRELGLAPPSVVRQLRAVRARLVHVHFGNGAVAMWPALRRLGLPVLVTLHGSDINIHREWWERAGAGPASRRYPRRLLELGRHNNVRFIAVSEAVRARAIAYGLPAATIRVCYIGVDTQRFRRAEARLGERPPRILYVGRMVEKKGAQILIEAFAALCRLLAKAELVMVGDGPLLEAFRARARAVGAPVQFLGRQPSDVVLREFQRASVFCLPSITADNGNAEGLPIVVMEAQACGVPVITSARGGATEGIIDGVTGIAFPERNVAALTQALVRVLDEPGLAARMSAAAERFARERFDIRACTAQLEHEYDEVASSWQPSISCRDA